MFFWALSIIGFWLLDILALVRLTDDEKDKDLFAVVMCWEASSTTTIGSLHRPISHGNQFLHRTPSQAFAAMEVAPVVFEFTS